MQRYQSNSNRNRSSGNDGRNSPQALNQKDQFNDDHDDEFDEDEHSQEQWDQDEPNQQWGRPFAGGYSNDFNEDDNQGFSTQSGKRGFGGRSPGNNSAKENDMGNQRSGYNQGQSPYGGQQNVGAKSKHTADINKGSQWGTGGGSKQWGNFSDQKGWGTGGSLSRGMGGKIQGGKSWGNEFSRQSKNDMDKPDRGRNIHKDRSGLDSWNERNKRNF